jgi:hypothetical protein
MLPSSTSSRVLHFSARRQRFVSSPDVRSIVFAIFRDVRAIARSQPTRVVALGMIAQVVHRIRTAAPPDL